MTKTERKPRYYRVVLILKDDPDDYEKYITRKELQTGLEDIRRSTVGLDLWATESIDRAEICERCGELISSNDIISTKFCDECVQDREIEREEAREARKAK